MNSPSTTNHLGSGREVIVISHLTFVSGTR
jgi:hypothetical protein